MALIRCIILINVLTAICAANLAVSHSAMAGEAVTVNPGQEYGIYYVPVDPHAQVQHQDVDGNGFHQQVVSTSPPESPPTIMVNPSISTTSPIVDVVGQVVGPGRIIALLVNGTETPIQPNGAFIARRGVLIGDNAIELAAIDEWGQTTKAMIKVTRTVPSNSAVEFPPLDPSRARGMPRPNGIALIIGIENYQNVPIAEYAENDARAFYDFATNALGVPASRIKLLTGNQSRRLDVQRAVRTWLLPLIVQSQSDVFVFFSGHGLASEDGHHLLLPYDGDPSLLAESSITRQELIGSITGAGASSITMFLDTCNSGGTRTNETLVASARPIRIVAKDEGVASNVTIFAASGNDQLSSSLAAAKHGLFSYFVMKGLEGDAAGADHTIRASALDAYLNAHVPAAAARIGRIQTPKLVGNGDAVISAW
jgi:Caspase domain